MCMYIYMYMYIHMSHAAHINELCHTHTWVCMLHTWEYGTRSYWICIYMFGYICIYTYKYMSHVTHKHDTYLIPEWVLSRTSELQDSIMLNIYINVVYIQLYIYIHESCHTQKCVVSYTQMSPVTHQIFTGLNRIEYVYMYMYVYMYIHTWIMSHTWISHVTHMNESTHTNAWSLDTHLRIVELELIENT